MYKIHNGDHLEYELENASVLPEDRSDWPLPSFDARDWAKAFIKLRDAKGFIVDEAVMLSWFSNALMRGYDEHSCRVAKEYRATWQYKIKNFFGTLKWKLFER